MTFRQGRGRRNGFQAGGGEEDGVQAGGTFGQGGGKVR